LEWVFKNGRADEWLYAPISKRWAQSKSLVEVVYVILVPYKLTNVRVVPVMLRAMMCRKDTRRIQKHTQSQQQMRRRSAARPDEGFPSNNEPFDHFKAS
jgi:hypothetical protein